MTTTVESPITFKETLHSKLQHPDSKQTSTHTMTVTIYCWIIPWLFCCGVVGVEPPPNPNPKFIPAAVLLSLVRGVPNPNPLLNSPPKADTREYCRHKNEAVTVTIWLCIVLLYMPIVANPMTWLSIVTSNETFINEFYLLVQFQTPHRTCHFECQQSGLLQETAQDARYGKNCPNCLLKCINVHMVTHKSSSWFLRLHSHINLYDSYVSAEICIYNKHH